MEMIIPFKGKVKFPITIDPSVWIFDDRRIDLTTYFETEEPEINAEEEYVKATSKHWEREIREGAVFPPTLKSERKFEKEKVLTGTFGIPLEPFLKNAEPLSGASKLIIETKEEAIEFPLEKTKDMILAFSKEGKPLKEDGPVHILFKDGSNRTAPIKFVQAFKVD
ncbi:peptidyl-prolyl cis-trans isomerase [Falsibacillus albus]|uniref:Peptidyl-prolyl cis-trans isomerase n=1 Tax=Falsibacillus albus TaxID=2478915 RepID=A0A3L7JYJ5_9BACI|nr:peptidyl-prolyl cis-trans isomerase [Falsibacillus albus]RLQ95877.1 peptidyl-prolyl cis-trans isomerase [Falsibacillus albus]